MNLETFKKLRPDEREHVLFLMSPITYSQEEFLQCLRWHVFYKFAEVIMEVSCNDQTEE